MKHTFLKSILLAMVLPVLAQAQSVRSTEFNLIKSIDRTIVRELSFPQTITYVETQDEHLFVLNDGNLNLRCIPIDTQYSVNDFVIKDSNVFFCGIFSNNDGFIGSFNWYDFFYLSHSYQVSNITMQTCSSTVQTLDRMVAYSSGHGYELVAVGRTAAGISCVVDAQYTTSVWLYRVGELSANSDDEILDIIVTDDRVITAGFRTHDILSFPCIRAYYKNDIFSPTHLQDSSFGFYHNVSNNVYEDQYFFDRSQLVLSPIDGNDFYLTAYWKHFNYNTYTLSHNLGVSVGHYKAAQTMGPEIVHDWTSLLTQPYNNGNWKLRGVTQPNNPNAYFYLLQEAEITGIAQPVSMLIDLLFSSLYASDSLKVHYTTEEKYHSIDGYNNLTQSILSGIKTAKNSLLRFFEGIGGQTSCMQTTVFNNEVKFSNPRLNPDPFCVYGFNSLSHITQIGDPLNIVNGVIQCQGKGAVKTEDDER